MFPSFKAVGDHCDAIGSDIIMGLQLEDKSGKILGTIMSKNSNTTAAFGAWTSTHNYHSSSQVVTTV
jgi:hypothetical protein